MIELVGVVVADCFNGEVCRDDDVDEDEPAAIICCGDGIGIGRGEICDNVSCES